MIIPGWIQKYVLSIVPIGLTAILVTGLGLFAIPVAALTLSTSCNDALNEVIWCGAATPGQVAADYTNGDGHNSAASIQNIYSAFSITSANISNMQTNAVAGTVTKSGDVIVNGNIVATNALTAGRQSIPGSTVKTYNGTTFYERPPSVSFLSNSLDAFVVMSAGRFDFAILSSCGNPVVGTATPPPPPTTSPNYTILKTVAVKGSNQFSSDVQVSPNSVVVYKVVVSSTGTAGVTNLIVKDTMPNDDTYNPSSFSINSQAEPDTEASSFFGSGLSLGTLPAGSSDTFLYSATVGANDNNANCVNETLPNVSSMQASNLPAESSTATVSIECTPPPIQKTPPPVVVTTVTSPPSTPSTPVSTQLVNTGPGNTIGVFVGVSLAGAAGYSLLLRRKYIRG